MMDWEPVYKVAMLSFLVGIILGVVVNKTNFCSMGAVSDWVNMENKGRLRSWFMAIGIATLVTQFLDINGNINLAESIYLGSNFGWSGFLAGGFIFGIGMTLASGCVNKTLVRVGGGNLKSLVVLLLVGITAYMTMRGLLALVRVNVFDVTNIELAEHGMSNQGIDTIVASLLGLENPAMVKKAVALIMGGGLVIFALSGKEFRSSFNNVLAGVAIGLLIPAGWYITGVVGFDDFEPLRLESYTFTGPAGEALMYLMTFTGSTVNFGIAAVFGVILGSFIYAAASRTFRIETFVNRSDMVRHVIGGILMGFGGVLALGCTIGQGITGMSTLALGSLLALISIILGSALTMKVDYYMMDEEGFLSALRQSLADMRLMPRSRKKA
jgi:uncharacterized membrane protein YedE/YeeE